MVLIAGVEDDPGVAEALGYYFREAGWEWRCFPGRSETLGALREFRPDVVTTGNRHPVLPGVWLLGAMKRDRELRRIPVVFVTALTKELLWASIRATGLDPDADVAGFVCKPYKPVELVAEIRRVLEASGAIPGSCFPAPVS